MSDSDSDKAIRELRKIGIEVVSKKESQKNGIENRGLRDQINLLAPLFHALVTSKVGLVIGIIGLLFFLIISYLGGILAGVATIIIVLLVLIFVLFPYFDIETINSASKGIPRFMGERIGTYIHNEGAVAVIKNVPIIGNVIDYIPIHIGTVDIDIPGVEVLSKDRFKLKLHMTMSINADRNRLIEFYNRGGTYGIDKKTGETNKEKEGDHGIVDLLKNIAIVSVQTTARGLKWEEIYNVDKSLRNDALQTITGTNDPEVDALLLDKTYNIPGIGTQLTNLTVGSPEAQGALARVIDKQPEEIAEREYRITDAETAPLLYQAATGITDEELKKVDKRVVERFYLRVKAIEQLEKEGGDEKFGDNILKISVANFLDDFNLENISDILNLFSKLKGGKQK